MNTKLNTILAVVIAVGFIGSNAALAQRTEESLEALIPKTSGQRSVLGASPGWDSDCFQAGSGRVQRSTNQDKDGVVEAVRTSVCASA